MMILLNTSYGINSVNRLPETTDNGVNGARAAVESFYYAFNNRSLETMKNVWSASPSVQLNNPLGGILRGFDGIAELYSRIFDGPARVWVEFHDIMEYFTGDCAVFAGRERGEFSKDGVTVPLAIRTTRIFTFDGAAGGWRMVHHHGSIDDPELLSRYQKAVSGRK